MKKVMASAVCAACLAIAPAAMAQAQGQANPPAMPRGPITTPLGTKSPEILLSKVTVSDFQKSLDFYTKVVGLQPAKTKSGQMAPIPAPGSDPAFFEYGLNFSGSMADPFFDIVIQRGIKPTPETAKLTVIGFKVPDAPAVIARAKAGGYKVVREAPVVKPGEMSIGMLLDPDGYQVEIIQAANY